MWSLYCFISCLFVSNYTFYFISWKFCFIFEFLFYYFITLSLFQLIYQLSIIITYYKLLNYINSKFCIIVPLFCSQCVYNTSNLNSCRCHAQMLQSKYIISARSALTNINYLLSRSAPLTRCYILCLRSALFTNNLLWLNAFYSLAQNQHRFQLSGSNLKSLKLTTFYNSFIQFFPRFNILSSYFLIHQELIPRTIIVVQLCSSHLSFSPQCHRHLEFIICTFSWISNPMVA